MEPTPDQALKQAVAVMEQVTFPGYSFEVVGDFTVPTYLQAKFSAPYTGPDGKPTGVTTLHHTRKWLLSKWMTRSELVQTAFKCVLTSVEHEAREQFTYRDVPVFGPHFNVEELVAIYPAGQEHRP